MQCEIFGLKESMEKIISIGVVADGAWGIILGVKLEEVLNSVGKGTGFWGCHFNLLLSLLTPLLIIDI
jgi:hypothetical protein